MRRGSKPDEHRGGRTGGTRNWRSILTDRILELAAVHANASMRALQRALVADRALPGDTRRAVASYPVHMRVAQKAKRLAEANNAQRLEALWAFAGDTTASEQERSKAAYQAAEILLPKVPSRSRGRRPFRTVSDLPSTPTSPANIAMRLWPCAPRCSRRHNEKAFNPHGGGPRAPGCGRKKTNFLNG